MYPSYRVLLEYLKVLEKKSVNEHGFVSTEEQQRANDILEQTVTVFDVEQDEYYPCDTMTMLDVDRFDTPFDVNHVVLAIKQDKE